jgi:hypothetical protein
VKEKSCVYDAEHEKDIKEIQIYHSEIQINPMIQKSTESNTNTFTIIQYFSSLNDRWTKDTKRKKTAENKSEMKKGSYDNGAKKER